MGINGDQIAGKTKDLAGKMTGNKKLQAKGKIQEAKGNMKEALKQNGHEMSHKIDHRMQNK